MWPEYIQFIHLDLRFRNLRLKKMARFVLMLYFCHFVLLQKSWKELPLNSPGSCLKDVSSKLVLSMLFSHLICHHSAWLTKVPHETDLGRKGQLKTFREICDPSVDTKRKYGTDYFVKRLGYCHIAAQCHQCSSKAFNTKQTEQNFDLRNKICCYDSLGETNMSGWRTAQFENICIAGCPRNLDSIAPDVDHVLNNKLV